MKEAKRFYAINKKTGQYLCTDAFASDSTWITNVLEFSKEKVVWPFNRLFSSNKKNMDLTLASYLSKGFPKGKAEDYAVVEDA